MTCAKKGRMPVASSLSLRRVRARPRPRGPGDQPVTIEYSVNRAAGRNLHRVRQAAQQALADLPRTPVRLLAPGCHDGGYHRLGQLVGVAERPARPIGQTLPATFLIAVQDLVTGLARDPELAAQGSHAFPIFQPNHEAYAFVHHRAFLPWHPPPPPRKGRKCNPSLRYVLSPMSRVGQPPLSNPRS
jgi:hypothetical protein